MPDRHREQALLPHVLPHLDLRRVQDLCALPIPVGAELARDGGASGDMDVECLTVIASKLCSHNVLLQLDLRRVRDWCAVQIYCGSKACSR